MRRLFKGVVLAMAVAVLAPAVSRADDQETAQKVANNMRTSGRMKGYNVGVKVQEGTAWLNGTDVPLDESAESYQVQVFNGSTLARTVTVSAAQSWIYPDATITADGFTSGQTITFTVAQNSDQGVLGHTATATAQR